MIFGFSSLRLWEKVMRNLEEKHVWRRTLRGERGFWVSRLIFLGFRSSDFFKSGDLCRLFRLLGREGSLRLSRFIFLLRLYLSKEFFHVLSTLVFEAFVLLVGRLWGCTRFGEEGFLLEEPLAEALGMRSSLGASSHFWPQDGSLLPTNSHC